MRLCRSWLVFGLVSVLTAPLLLRAAVIYKWTDADGVVHFSDQPAPGAEKVVIDGTSTRGVLSQAAPGALPPTPPKALTALGSTHISIDSPASEQTFSGSEPMVASATVDPPIAPNGPITIAWSLNGSPLSEGDGSTHFNLPPDLPRGSYTLSATLTDTASGETKSANTVTFSVLRPTLLAPQRR
jgi:hypothetical protein